MYADRIDYSPLTARPSREEITAAAAQRTSTAAFVAALVGGFLTLIVGIVLIVTWVGGDLNGESVATAAVFLACCMVVVFVIALIVQWRHLRGNRRAARLRAFCDANGLRLQLEAPAEARPGSLLGVTKATVYDQVTWHHRGLDFEAARYWRYQRNNTLDVRYLAVRLSVDAPALLFGDWKGSFGPTLRGGSDARAELDHPLLALEVDHSRARVFLTEQLAQALTAGRRPANAEVVDGWFFAYFRGTDMLDEVGWRQIFAVADAVADAQECLTSR